MDPDSVEKGLAVLIGVLVPSSVLDMLSILIILLLILHAYKVKRCFKQEQDDTNIHYDEVDPETTPTHVQETAIYSIADPVTDQQEQNDLYEPVEPNEEISLTVQEADLTAADSSTGTSTNPTHRILTSQNVDKPFSTTTNDEDDYYVNEGINNPGISMMQNEAYGDITGQSSSSRVTGSLDGTSIPTTRNEAYTSVSTNTERVDTEEPYDYVRYL